MTTSYFSTVATAAVVSCIDAPPAGDIPATSFENMGTALLIDSDNTEDITTLTHRIAHGKAIIQQKKDECDAVQSQLADAIGEEEARALLVKVASDPSAFLDDKRRLVREAAYALQAADNSEADVIKTEQTLADINLTVPELKAMMVKREAEMYADMETQMAAMREEMESKLSTMRAEMAEKMSGLEDIVSRVSALERCSGFKPNTRYHHDHGAWNAVQCASNHAPGSYMRLVYMQRTLNGQAKSQQAHGTSRWDFLGGPAGQKQIKDEIDKLLREERQRGIGPSHELTREGGTPQKVEQIRAELGV